MQCNMSLDELLDPQRVSQLTPEEAARLLPGVAAAIWALTVRAATVLTERPTSCAEPDRLLTMPEVSTITGIPESKVRELGRRGELPTVRIGKYVRVRQADLTQYVDTRSLPLVTSPRRDRA